MSEETEQEPIERGELDDPRKVGRKATLERLKKAQEDKDFVYVLSSAEGRRFLWRLLQDCGMYKSSFSESSERMAFYEGNRNIGLKLMAKLSELAPEALLIMMQEDKREKAEKNQERLLNV